MSRRGVMRLGVAALMACAALAAAGARAQAAPRKMALIKLPRNVVAAVRKACPGAKMLSAERDVEVADGAVIYEYGIKVRLRSEKTADVRVWVSVQEGKVKVVDVRVQEGDEDDDDD